MVIIKRPKEVVTFFQLFTIFLSKKKLKQFHLTQLFLLLINKFNLLFKVRLIDQTECIHKQLNTFKLSLLLMVANCDFKHILVFFSSRNLRTIRQNMLISLIFFLNLSLAFGNLFYGLLQIIFIDLTQQIFIPHSEGTLLWFVIIYFCCVYV